jgi:hypothetical protein
LVRWKLSDINHYLLGLQPGERPHLA